MSRRKPMTVARLWWSPQNVLWLAAWPVATLVPVWFGPRQDRPPDGWRWRMGEVWSEEGISSWEDAAKSAEFCVLGQLASVGVRAAEFCRPDGSVRTLEMPDGCY